MPPDNRRPAPSGDGGRFCMRPLLERRIIRRCKHAEERRDHDLEGLFVGERNVERLLIGGARRRPNLVLEDALGAADAALGIVQCEDLLDPSFADMNADRTGAIRTDELILGLLSTWT